VARKKLGIALGVAGTIAAGLVAVGVLGRSPERVEMPPFLGLPERLALEVGDWALKPAFPNITFDDPVGLVQGPFSNTMLVLEREGEIIAFQNQADTTKRRRVLNMLTVTQGEVDSGLLGLVFHPEFGIEGSPNRTYAYVHYAYTPNPVRGKWPPYDKPTRSRLSRFNVDPKTFLFDPKSELVLIDQEDESIFHQGGSMFFHPKDGFLYLSVGDEGGSSCSLHNCQIIDKDLFSGVLRIDVNQKGGNISHPIVKQPATGKTANYFIPNDNPWVGVPGALEEFYAIGLRSPHRMTYDETQDITWIADVGQKAREELDILKRGANYQWVLREGFMQRQPTPENVLGVWTDPVLDLPRDESSSIIGGHVYRGKLLPSLQGKYIYGDFVSGNIWALDYDYDGEKVTVKKNEKLIASKYRNRKNGITSFGVDADGELYVMTLGKKSKILRITPTKPSTNAPKLLSDIGLLGVKDGKPKSGLLAYDVASPLWSDGAVKDRWMSLPKGQVHFDAKRAWKFPEGTVFIKHFAMALDEREPDETRPLETRLFVAARHGSYYGLTYRWKPDLSDAELVLARQEEVLEITGTDGQKRQQAYVYPGPYDCMTCHNEEAGYVLGVRTEQLNQPVSGLDALFEDNPLVDWSRRGVLDWKIDDESAATGPKLVALDDETHGMEERLRSYWASNCAMCHGAGPKIRSNWDARWSTPFAKQGILDGPLENGERVEGERVIAPGDLERSAIYTRSTSDVVELRMPPIGRRRADPRYAALLERWIQSLPAKHAAAEPEGSAASSR
jgi:glucose/arabinose dehydrogenase